MYSVLIPTRRKPEQIYKTLKSVLEQTKKAEDIFLIMDLDLDKEKLDKYKIDLSKYLDNEELDKITFVNNVDSDFIPEKGVSYVRNFGIKLTKSKYLLSVDDDNVFDKKFIETFLTVRLDLNKPCLLIPTEKSKLSAGGHGNKGYDRFCYVLGVQVPAKESKKLKNNTNLIPIKFSSSNCLFADTQLFKESLFDERFLFCYEDFDITNRISSKHPMYAVSNLKIDHQMRKKTPLQQTYLDNTFDAFQKSKNRVLFVKNNSSLGDKILYFTTGLHIHTAFLFYKILRYASIKNIPNLMWAVISGTLTGILSKKYVK